MRGSPLRSSPRPDHSPGDRRRSAPARSIHVCEVIAACFCSCVEHGESGSRRGFADVPAESKFIHQVVDSGFGDLGSHGALDAVSSDRHEGDMGPLDCARCLDEQANGDSSVDAVTADEPARDPLDVEGSVPGDATRDAVTINETVRYPSDVEEHVPEDPAVSVSCGLGGRHCVVTRAGRVYCWGGYRADGTDDALPTMVPFGVRVTSVGSSSGSRIASDVNGRLWSWGTQLPNSVGGRCVQWLPPGMIGTPELVDGVAGVARIESNFGYDLAISSMSGLFHYQYRSGSSDDGCLRWLQHWQARVVSASRSYNHVCAVTVGGALECFDLGPDGRPPRISLMWDVGPTPTRLSFIDDLVRISMGREGQCAIRRDRTLHCWGYAEGGQLGVGNLEHFLSGRIGQRVPTRVEGLSDVREVEFDHVVTLALTGDGTLWAWGRPRNVAINVAASDESCPDGARADCVNRPSRVVDVQDVTAFSACDGNGLCVVTRSGRVFCSGRWSGDGTAEYRPSPVEVRWE